MNLFSFSGKSLLFAISLSLLVPDAYANTKCLPVPAQPTEQQVRAAAKNAKDRGVLYQVSKNGSVSFLYATSHLSRLEWFFPGPKTLAAIRMSNVLAIELNTFDPKVAERDDKARRARGGIVYPLHLKRRIQALASKLCIPGRPGNNVAPAIQVLREQAAIRRGIFRKFSMESFLNEVAKRRGIELVGLETVEQRHSFRPPELSKSERLDRVMKMVDDLESGEAVNAVLAITNAWADGHLGSVQSSCPNCTEESISWVNRRNQAMADKFDSLVSDGKIVFAAAGALHFIEPMSLGRLLRKKGYWITRVKFDN